MKNRNKTLTGLAAASMVMTQVGQMSVFAKEEPMKVLSDKERQENIIAIIKII